MEILTSLIDTQRETLSYFYLSETDLAKSYKPGKWTIREILMHLADSESVLHERIKRTIAEHRPVVWSFDQDRWAQRLKYASFPLSISRAVFIANRDSVIYLAEQFYTTLGHNEFIHSETGLRTLKDEFDKVAWHNRRHLEQIEQALATVA
jgi:hypothetical protein